MKFAPKRKLVTDTREAEVYDRTSTVPNLYNCDLCDRQFLAGCAQNSPGTSSFVPVADNCVRVVSSLSGFEHYWHCQQCEDFDICEDCLPQAKKSHHRGAHTFSEVVPGQDVSG